MIKRLALVGVMTLAILAACSKQAPPQPADDEEAAAAARVGKQPTPAQPVSNEKTAEGMLALIDTAPQCQQYRTRLEEGGKAPPDQVTTDDLSLIVAEAFKAGCTKKRQAQ
jgi:hypothetical protein